jgi:hypothetical protein
VKGVGRGRLVRRRAAGHRAFGAPVLGATVVYAAFRAAADRAFRRFALGGPAQRASRAPAPGTALGSAAFRPVGARAFRSAAPGALGAAGHRLFLAGRDGALGGGRAVGGRVLGAVQRPAGQLGRYVAGGRRDAGGRWPRRPVDGQRTRLGLDPAVVTLKEIREALGLRGVDADHHPWLAHRLPERVTHVTGQRIGRPG